MTPQTIVAAKRGRAVAFDVNNMSNHASRNRIQNTYYKIPIIFKGVRVERMDSAFLKINSFWIQKSTQ
jgi:hypothetical protein